MCPIYISKYQKQKKVILTEKNSIVDLLTRDFSFGNGQLSDKKKESFYHELSMLLKSGIAIKMALELTSTSFKGNDEKLFQSLLRQLIAGSPLSKALQDSRRFSAYEYHSIKIGEETGKLDLVMGELAKYFKAKVQQRRKIIAVLTYPVLVLFTSFGAIFFMIKFVVPMFGDVFVRFGGKLPYITSLIISISNWLDRYMLLMFFILNAAAIFYFSVRKAEWFRKHSTIILLRLPVVGDIVKKIYLSRLANTMSLLTSTNTPLLTALTMVREMISFYPIVQSLYDVEKEIMYGSSLSAALQKHSFYPIKFVQMIKIAEEVNRLEYFFAQLAEQYVEEVEYRTNTISSVLEPLIIIFLGVAVGVILIAMYLPMFQMSNSID
jgi:type IV pilus assembly protein PilC